MSKPSEDEVRERIPMPHHSFKNRKAILGPRSQCCAYLNLHHVIRTVQYGASLKIAAWLKLDFKKLWLEEARVWGIRSLTSSSLV